MDIKKLNEELRKLLQEKQINELSSETIASYASKRSEQIKSLQKKLNKYKNNVDKVSKRDIITLFGKDYTNEVVDYLDIHINPQSIYINIDGIKRKWEGEDSDKFSFKGCPKKVKHFSIFSYDSEQQNFEFFPENVEVLEIHGSMNSDDSQWVKSSLCKYIKSLNRVKTLQCASSVQGIAPIKTDKLILDFRFDDKFLASCGCKEVVCKDGKMWSSVENTIPLPKNIKIFNVDDARSLNTFGLTPDTNKVQLITNCIYCTELQRWFDKDDEWQIKYALEDSGIDTQEAENTLTQN